MKFSITNYENNCLRYTRSLVVDSTPDITKVDQLTVAVRYTNFNGSAIGLFLGFSVSVKHKSQKLLMQNFQS